ncbi:MAG TPA: 16S rRNA (cytidine(1402)-2'-O)-methyltransferase [Patescibacteria group bacterium]|jgi:16S rRNA (cytidine1402-2'-O)-methyltransferase|nr:16S rRNA (cytidine(1402)-2'-O)-methyltransferase [Patescibacteria group bacterium]
MLYIVPTPLGNLKDISERAKEQLAACDFIIAENPLTTHKLLRLLDLPKKQIVQFADHNEQQVLDKYLARLENETACMVSDAGTPGISDPGFRLVRACRQQGIEVVAIPGASAAVTALSASGLPTDKFLFMGFLQKTEPKVIEAVTTAKNAEATLVTYESPQRILKTVQYIEKSFPEANIVVARELTKLHEEYLSGTASEVVAQLKAKPSIKGEITLLVSFK